MFKINDNYNWVYFAITIVIIMFFIKKCEGEPRTIVKTKIEHVKVTDTITNIVIETHQKTVYVERLKTIKGKDSIIYKTKPNSTTIQANKYAVKLKSNNAVANVNIVATGELIDVTGTIDYTKEIKTVEKTTIRDASGLFLYGETSIVPTFERAEIGLDYQLKNKIIIGTSFSYENLSKTTYLNFKIGFKIF